jgi:serine O-acetyltransferase
MQHVDATMLRIIKALLWYPKFSAVFLFRCSSTLYRENKLAELPSRFFWLLNYYLHGCELSARAIVAPGFNVPHPHGVVVGMARIGKNTTILQHVTVGQRDYRSANPDDQKLPTIGEGVTIFVGAVVVGTVTIGDQATVGANAVVMQDVPPGCTAVGVPARILPPKEGSRS